MAKNDKRQAVPEKTYFPPVVAVLGHVDHGKTTLLDTIRKTSIAEREHGGITQKIGASSVEIQHDNKKQRITFIDTPGHEAFAKMRGRGALASDIALLIVSATDGVMPQTKESIQLVLESKVPFIVVLTKADLPTKNTEKVKQQLLRENVMLEGLGGDVPIIEVSARTGMNIKELLELILLVFEMHDSEERAKLHTKPLKAIIIESKLDNRSGPRATLIIKEGKLSLRDQVYCEGVEGKVKTIINDKNEQLQSATVGDAVEVLGFEKVPAVGGVVYKRSEISQTDQDQITSTSQTQKQKSFTHQDTAEGHSFSIIICADTQGSLEAIMNALPAGVTLIDQKTGEISEADILMAKSVNAFILGFNAKIRGEVTRLAATEKVLIRNYAIIYEMMDEITDVLEGKRLALIEKIYGKAKILASFPFEKTKALGVVVLEGRIAKGDKIRMMRGEDIIGESMISSLRSGKNPVSKIEKGQEAGAIISPLLDFTIGDVIVCHG